MPEKRSTAQQRRFGGALVGVSVFASALAFSGSFPFETVAAFAADPACTPGTVTLSSQRVEKNAKFTALVCGLKEGTRVRGEYRKATPSLASGATSTPVEAQPVEAAPIGYSRDIATVGPDGRATVTFLIAEPGAYTITVAPIEGGTASQAQVDITDNAPPTTKPSEPSDPAPSSSTEPTKEPTGEPTGRPSETPTPKPTPKPAPEPTQEPEPTHSPSKDPTDNPEPSPTKGHEPTDQPGASPSEPKKPSPLPDTGDSASTEPSREPSGRRTTPSRGNTKSTDSSTEASGSDFVRPKASAMSRIPGRDGYGRSADFGAVGSDYSKLTSDGNRARGTLRPGPTPSANPAKREEESTEGSTQLITDPSRQPLGLSVAWLIGGVIGGLGLAATGAIVLMRRNNH